MIRLYLLFLLLATLSFSYIPYQAHSFNDLNLLRNIIHKGVNYYKVDISMATRQSCEQHSNWKGNTKCLNTTQEIPEICCLAMRGDASSRPFFDDDFNTTDDFIALLNAQLGGLESGRKLLFAINFQYGHQFSDFLTEKFLLDLAQVEEKFKQSVLIGTGSDSFILQYDRICRGQQTQICTPERNKIANSNFFLQTSSFHPYDPRDHKKRYRNFNVMFKEIETFCKEGFPSWINNYPQFPLIFWEPSDEKQIQYVLSKYLSPSCVQKHKRSIEGMAMASNIDAEMFKNYMKSMVEEDRWDTATNKGYIRGSNMKIVKTKIDGVESIIGVHKKSGETVIRTYSVVNGKISLKSMKTTQLIPSTQRITQLTRVGEHFVIVTQLSSESSNIYYFTYEYELSNVATIDKVYSTTSRGEEFIYVKLNKDSNKYFIKGTTDFSNFNEYGSFQTQYTISSMAIYGEQFLILGSKSGQSYLISVKNTDIIHDKLLTYGSNPTILKLENGNLAILVEDSICHSGLLMNNNHMNKCNFYEKDQFSSLANVHGITNFIYSTYDQILLNQNIITACHPEIKFTKLMNSYDVDLAEINGALMISGRLLPVEQQDLVAALFCGGSNFDGRYLDIDGIILTSVELPKKEEKQLIIVE